jgi:nitrogen fixation/metabolism regulation signal transduction histidine kinase
MNLLIILLSNIIFFILCFYNLPHNIPLVIFAGLSLLGLNAFVIVRHNKAQNLLVKSLEQGFLNFIDGDFSASLPDKISHQYKPLFDQFNQASEFLRCERQRLYQREMLLDMVINASSVITLLIDHRGKVVFANQQCGALFKTDSLIGSDFTELTKDLSHEFKQALHVNDDSQGLDSIFTSTDDYGQSQAWHISRSSVRLNLATHTLFLLKPMTEQLAKQESNTWKKVIKVLSHELNNSIAPISSMCHSGKLISKKLDEPKLDRVFNSISGRINHLSEFVSGYASFAKLRQPIKAPIEINDLMLHLAELYPFQLDNQLTCNTLNLDQSQFEQVLVNLLKNADEAAPQNLTHVNITEIKANTDKNRFIKIDIIDTGSGMSEEVLQHALLPFYSTKHSGTGLGLALCKDIIEAHQGKLLFNNLSPQGFCVSVIIPV